MLAYVDGDKALKRSLALNISAITCGMVFFTIVGGPIGTSSIFTGFMRMLGAGDFTYSIVLALPVLGAVMQIVGSYYMEVTGKRRFLFLASGFLNRVTWIPVALIPLILGQNNKQGIIISITIIIIFSSIGGSVNSVAFNSWMGSLVPENIIGRYFGIRALISTASGAIAALVMGYYVDRFDNLNGFIIVFLVAAFFGIADIATFFAIQHPTFEKPKVKPSLKSILIEPMKDRNYLRFVMFTTFYAFGVNLSSPFFNLYMLENLKMGYFLINLSGQVMAAITTILVVRKWGSLADRYGNKPVLKVCAIINIIVPMFWVLTSPSTIGLIFVINIFAGIGWSGYNLAVFNQSVWLAPEKNRSAFTASFNLFNSVIGTALAYICGGYFIDVFKPIFNRAHIPFFMGTTLCAYVVLFLLSSVLRLIAMVLFMPHFTEKGAKSAGEMVKDEGKLLRYRLFKKAN